ncbi:hypothetical protein C8R48DRAFT_673275 [Suillus tomentosus]|nr:hypothetical protein C8R48DRAFT_673275 [Suillus tomentosus]
MTRSKGSEVCSRVFDIIKWEMHQQSQTDKDRTWYGGSEKLERPWKWMDDLRTTWTSVRNFRKIGNTGRLPNPRHSLLADTGPIILSQWDGILCSIKRLETRASI